VESVLGLLPEHWESGRVTSEYLLTEILEDADTTGKKECNSSERSCTSKRMLATVREKCTNTYQYCIETKSLLLWEMMKNFLIILI
jgi:hypothetical protein